MAASSLPWATSASISPSCPKAEQETPHWQTAAAGLMLACDADGSYLDWRAMLHAFMEKAASNLQSQCGVATQQGDARHATVTSSRSARRVARAIGTPPP